MFEAINNQIENIFYLFRASRTLADEAGPCNELETHLAAASGPHTSVVFEGAAAGLAYRQLQAGAVVIEVPDWFAHAAQVHIGIGWAMAELALRPDVYLTQFSGVMQGRVLDGFGYYSGLFRRRRCIQAMDIPAGIPTDVLTAFDQGLGRAMWYISKGDVEPLMAMIRPFQEERKKGIWRGIGVAASYIGGVDLQGWHELIEASNEKSRYLKTGVLLCAASRKLSNTTTTDVNLALAAFGAGADSAQHTIEQLNNANTYLNALAKIEAT